MPMIAVSIDVTGSGRPMDIAYLNDTSIGLHKESGIADVVDWIRHHQPTIVAVDAPSKKNLGLVPKHREKYSLPEKGYDNFRIAEAVLKRRGIGLYNTSKVERTEDRKGWRQRGAELYAGIQKRGYSLFDTPGAVDPCAKRIIEVHPHASFVVGLGWIPQSKHTLAGQLERLAYLTNECANLGIKYKSTPLAEDHLQSLKQIKDSWKSIAKDGISLPRISHDKLDAIVGLTTAIRALRGEAVAVGHTADGVILLPKQLSESAYQYKHK